jgi:hypothetical protein
MEAEIGWKAQIPNPALKPLEAIVGEWETTGIHPYFPDVAVRGRTSFAWQDGGAFLVWRSEVDHPQFPSGIAIFGSDDEAKTWFITYFDSRGVSRKYDITLEPDGFTMHRETEKFSQRATFRIEAGGDRIVSRGEMSRDGGAWEGDLSTTYERVKP